MNQSLRVVAADIGGTSSRFALFEIPASGQPRLAAQVWLSTERYESFQQLLQAVEDSPEAVSLRAADAVVLAVPGPVTGGTFASLVNVRWDMDVRNISLPIERLYLINDFEAQAYGCLAESRERIAALRHPERVITRGFTIVGPGTGLGHCAIRRDGERWLSIPSEAGQVLFPFYSAEEQDYLAFLRARLGEYPTGDRVLSGRGLALLHEFLTGRAMTPAEVAAAIAPDSQTTRWFARLLGRNCRNYVLSLLGICDVLYLSGGVIIKNPFLAENDQFVETFLDSGTKRAELEQVGIGVVRDESLGLLGCAQYGLLALTGEGVGAA